jgi:hypothetical protein
MLARFVTVIVVNATKTQKYETPLTSKESLLAALEFCSFYFIQKCNFVYIAENFT